MRANTTRKQGGSQPKTMFGKVHKVLHCRNSALCPLKDRKETTWNRDVNAAKNILMLGLFEVLGYARPDAFRRADASSCASMTRTKKTITRKTTS